jgi:signal transduction histidine kinase
MSFYLLLPLIQTLCCLVLIAMVLKGHSRSFTHRLFSLFLLGLTYWGIIIFNMRASPDIEHAYFWERWLVPLGPFISVFFYHFSVRYSGIESKGWLLGLLYFICFAFIPLALTHLVFSGMQLKYYGYAPVLGSIVPIWMLFSYLILVMALLNFIRMFRNPNNADQRNRATYIIIGMSFALAGGVFDILPVIGLPLYPGVIIGNIIFCLLTTVAILKYKLLDIHIVVRKGTAYILTSALISIPFIGVFLLVTYFFEGVRSYLWVYFTLLIALAFALPQFWQRIQQRVDRWFFRNRYDYLKALETFSQESQSITDSERLGATIVKLLIGALRTSSIYVLQPVSLGGDFITVFSSSMNNPASTIGLRSRDALVRWLERSNSMLSYKDIEIIPQLVGITSQEKQTLQHIGAELIVPLKSPSGQLLVVLILGKKLSEQPYTMEEKQLVATIGSQMVINLENARLYAASQQEITERKRAEESVRRSHEQLRNLTKRLNLVREEERKVIAREIHDGLGQSLTVIKMDLHWLKKKMLGESEPLIKKIDSTTQITDKAISTVKKISTQLRPAELDDFGLWAAIESQAKEFEELSTIKFRFYRECEIDIPDPGARIVIFRIFQEALTNIVRHAYATQVDVSLKREGDNIVLRVEDNGKGITEDQISSRKSLGLLGMRERAYAYNGRVEFVGHPSKGTSVTVTIPIKSGEKTDDKDTSG